ncbi:major facilitator transporter [Azospirillum sp. B510]|uniref:MFS transporter n=1 Tax=Azospirillum sp. (strain B510) TaxID=137722 RepID=UPI0001C4BF3A|nr:major facilitator transporter [Azospirillum sp. B510]
MTETSSPAATAPAPFPWSNLLALAMAGFITILTEALPAGLLPQIGASLGVSEALAGQLVTLYAAGSLAAAIPLTTATQGMRRRPLLLIAIFGFAVANTATALSGSYGLTLVARLMAGGSAGLLWALIAGYAARMVPEGSKGRAIAVAMIGTPLALSLGIPAGTYSGAVIGWRASFGIMSGLSLILIAWVAMKVPDFAGQAEDKRRPLGHVFVLPGIRPVLFVTLTFVLAHNILYTYIAPLLSGGGGTVRTDLALLVFGLAALAGIWIVGLLIDHHLRPLTLISIALFGLAVLALGIAGHAPEVALSATGLWGLAFGGVATLFQTALAKAAGDMHDLAQCMLVTAWNAAIAGGGLIGGLLLDHVGAGAFAPVALLLLAAAYVAVHGACRHGFPHSFVP